MRVSACVALRVGGASAQEGLGDREWCPVLPGPWRRQATTSTCPPWGPRPPLSQRHPATAREMWPTITTNRTCDWGVCLELLVSGAWKPV